MGRSSGVSGVSWSTQERLLRVRITLKLLRNARELIGVWHRFPYVDTLKVLEKWGPGCYFYPDGSDQYIDELDDALAKLKAENPSHPPILSLFTELPSNPLLRSINLPRLRQLADKYDFPIVIDDTIGNFVNVDTLRYADVVVSSLSKLFSGRADAMGGR